MPVGIKAQNVPNSCLIAMYKKKLRISVSMFAQCSVKQTDRFEDNQCYNGPVFVATFCFGSKNP